MTPRVIQSLTHQTVLAAEKLCDIGIRGVVPRSRAQAIERAVMLVLQQEEQRRRTRAKKKAEISIDSDSTTCYREPNDNKTETETNHDVRPD